MDIINIIYGNFSQYSFFKLVIDWRDYCMLDILDNNKIKNIHFIGIGGIGMSAIAQILLDKGYFVSGSDLKSSNITEKLKASGAEIFIGHDKANVINADLIVYTSAVKDDNPEIIKSKEIGIPLLDRAEILGKLMKQYKNSIAISGAHGKTTTTSMISLIFANSQFDPTILVGGELKEIGGNVKVGDKDFFITEACEYQENFLKFNPTVGVILNIDEDHLDFFKDLDHIISSFSKFAKLIPKAGYLVVNNDDYNTRKLSSHFNCNVVTYGINVDSIYEGKNITFNEEGLPSFDVFCKGIILDRFSLQVPGYHNIYNSLAAIATCHVLGVPLEVIKETLREFKGTSRRFDILGKSNNVMVIDDYAHHPTEIRATLNAVTKYPHNRIWCVFQPHTYTRTKSLLMDFASSFSDGDKIIITDIYAAREKNTGNIHSKDLVNLIHLEGKDVTYIQDFKDIVSYLQEEVEEGDIILTMGAGNIHEVGEEFLKEY